VGVLGFALADFAEQVVRLWLREIHVKGGVRRIGRIGLDGNGGGVGGDEN
jgi:hypothetical protein